MVSVCGVGFVKNLKIPVESIHVSFFYAKIKFNSFPDILQRAEVKDMKHTIKELPESERPYEKCIREGESALSDSELLAVILRCGTRGVSSLALANDIMNYMKESSYPGLAGILHSSLSDLRKIHGVGKVKPFS